MVQLTYHKRNHLPN